MSLFKIISSTILLVFTHTASAQNLNSFNIAAEVNDEIITNYEIEQRILMLRIFGIKNVSRELIIDTIIEETLFESSAKKLKLMLSDSELDSSFQKFAKRGGTNKLDLLRYLNIRNIAPETLENYLKAGILKQKVIQTKFAKKIKITQKEIENAIAHRKNSMANEEYKLGYLEISSKNKDSFKILNLIKNKVDNCFDLALEVKKYKNINLKQYEINDKQSKESIPDKLNSLDVNEKIIIKNNKDKNFLLMLCSRELELSKENLMKIKNELFDNKIKKRGTIYIQELKNNAYISIKWAYLLH